MRASDSVRADGTDADQLSAAALASITEHFEESVRRARRAALICVAAVIAGALVLAWARNTSQSLGVPLWVPLALLAGGAVEMATTVRGLNDARHDAESLARRPLRALSRPVVSPRRGEAERWVLLYATGKQAPAPPAPFAAVPAVGAWPVAAPALLVDVAGIPKQGRLLAVADAATGQLVGFGRVASTAKTVALMRTG